MPAVCFRLEDVAIREMLGCLTYREGSGTAGQGGRRQAQPGGRGPRGGRGRPRP